MVTTRELGARWHRRESRLSTDHKKVVHVSSPTRLADSIHNLSAAASSSASDNAHPTEQSLGETNKVATPQERGIHFFPIYSDDKYIRRVSLLNGKETIFLIIVHGYFLES